MKTLLTTIVLMIGFSVYAGPEDHFNSQSCYDIQIPAGEKIPSSVPAEICLESLNIDLNQQTISIYSFFQSYAELYKNLKLSSLVRKNEDWVSFEASSVLLNKQGSVCGEGEFTVMSVAGMVDTSGDGNINTLNFTVRNEGTHDTCHLEPQITTYTYRVR